MRLLRRLLIVAICFAPLLALGSSGSHEITPTATWKLGGGHYAYDGSGNIRKIGSSVFVYDRDHRLVSEGTKQKYTYDGFGNIRTYRDDDGITYTVGAASDTNRASVASSSAFHMSGTYDGAGNMVGRSDDIFRYDDLSVMTRSFVDGQWQAYVYNANDERVGTIATTAETGGVEESSDWTIRDPAGQVLRRFSKEGGQYRWQQDYIYRDRKMLASEVTGQTGTLHYHLDHLGTPRLITGNGGTEVSRHTYYPFGKETPGAPDPGEDKKFTGHERDAGGLDYMHARYYDSRMGRFLSIDPTWESADLTAPQSWNRYTYVLNNPLRYTDPDGKIAIADDAIYVLLAVGTLTAYISAPSATHPGMSNGQAMAQSAVDAVKAVGTAVASVAESLKSESPDRIIIGETMERVHEGAIQAGARPLAIEGRNAVEESAIALTSALASGARIFDVGEDPDRHPAHRSAAYPAELAVLTASGRIRVAQSTVRIRGADTTLWEWVAAPKP